MLFSFPPEAQSERSAFTVVGQARPGGALAGEVMLVPRSFSAMLSCVSKRYSPSLPQYAARQYMQQSARLNTGASSA